jgi:hypothetical protein
MRYALKKFNMKMKFLSGLLILLINLPNTNFAQCIQSNAGGNTFSSELLSGFVSWSNVSNAQSSDNNRADAGFLLGVLATVNTDYLKAENFNFSIPAGTVICGIEVGIERRGSGITIGSSIQDNIVRLEKSGVLAGSNYASATSWTGSDFKATYGGPTDLWGTTWTPAQINATNFGCLLSAKLNSGLASVFLQAEVDYIEIVIYYNTAPLPVELLNFDLSLIEGNKVRADWATASEKNNFYFEVQRSSNGIEWKSIKTINGAGNSDKLIHYNCVDENPLEGVSFYRLKQTDFDGKMNYHEMKSIDMIQGEEMIKINPNPATNCITLNCLKNKDASMILYIYDIDGRLVKQTDRFEIKKGILFSAEVIITELNNGMYFYRAVADEKVVAGRIVKN